MRSGIRRLSALVALAMTVLPGAASAQMPGAAPAQLKVMTSGGFARPLAALLPEFEKASGISVAVTQGPSQGPGPTTIGAQLARGVPADLVILSREGLNDLIAQGRIVAGSDIDLAKTPIGVAVQAGAARPDISTVAAFRQALLNAKSITYPASTTGIYMATRLFPQMGIAEALKPKSSNVGVVAVGRGEVEMAIQPVSELLHQPGTDYVGAIPAEIQYISVFSTAAVKGGNEADARRLIEFIKSGKADAAMKDSGLEPLHH
jgi:molybdate transport system substrate-binding protein